MDNQRNSSTNTRYATATTAWAGANGIAGGACILAAVPHPFFWVPATVLLLGVGIQVALAWRGPR